MTLKKGELMFPFFIKNNDIIGRLSPCPTGLLLNESGYKNYGVMIIFRFSQECEILGQCNNSLPTMII
jgi:hypothetical protein